MNKLLSAVSAIGMLFAVSAAQAGEPLTDQQLDTITAGAMAAVGVIVNNAQSGGNFRAGGPKFVCIREHC